MTAIRWSALSTLAGQVWSTLLTLAVVPFYLRWLGPESYGLIGFYVSLQLAINVLDLGLAVTANREFARRTSDEREKDGRSLLRTLEIVYVGMAVAIAITIAAASGWISTHWLQAFVLPAETVRTAIMLMGLTIALRWPTGLYVGVLRGLELQPIQNLITVAVATLRAAGALAVLFVVPRIDAFFWWQAGVSLVELAAFGLVTWRRQGARAFIRAMPDLAMFRSLWRFSSQLTLISLFAVVLKQLDKLLLARLVPLESLGYYMLAASLSSGVLLVATAAATATFPRFSALFAASAADDAMLLYRRANRAVAVLVVPIASTMIFFAEPLLALWTRSTTVAAISVRPLMVLAAAAGLNAMMQVPFAMQIAAGKPRLALLVNGGSVLMLAPLTITLVSSYGILGAGLAWLAFNIVYYAIVSWLIERQVFERSAYPLLWRDTIAFCLGGTVIFGTAGLFAREVDAWHAWIYFASAAFVYALLFARRNLNLIRLSGTATSAVAARAS